MVAKDTHFGSYQRYVDRTASNGNSPKPKFLKPLPHAWEECPCEKCDMLRQENAAARTSINWPPDYPPKFYERKPPDYESQYGADPDDMGYNDFVEEF